MNVLLVSLSLPYSLRCEQRDRSFFQCHSKDKYIDHKEQINSLGEGEESRHRIQVPMLKLLNKHLSNKRVNPCLLDAVVYVGSQPRGIQEKWLKWCWEQKEGERACNRFVTPAREKKKTWRGWKRASPFSISTGLRIYRGEKSQCSESEDS